MISFVHTADIHFGMENYGKIDPKTGIHTRLLDFVRALDYCIDFAIEHNVDFFLFSGDAYKTHNPSPTQQRLLFRCLLRLYHAKIPIVMVVGNHDNPLSFGKTNALEILGELPLDGFHVVTKPHSFVLPTKNGPVQIVGIPWPTRNNIALSRNHAAKQGHEITSYIEQAVAAIINHHAQQLDPTIPAVLAAHITVSNGIFSGSEKRAIYGTDPMLLPSQLAIPPFDYVGLGHLHRFQNLQTTGGVPIIYSGSIERIDFGERKEEKGFCFVRIKKKYETEYQFIQGPSRPFIQIETTLSDSCGISHTQQLLQLLQQTPIQDSVIKIVYHLTSEQQDLVDLATIQRACQDAMYLVGVLPRIQQCSRQRRIGALKTDISLEELLTLYFQTKPEYRDRHADLLEKTLMLAQEKQDHSEHE